MIRYLSLGHRQFGICPLVSTPRTNWEFYAVVRGRCAPVLENHPRILPATRTLWIFPPGSSHGWSGVGAQRSTIACFHFSVVPPQLDAIVKPGGHLEVSLSTAECNRIVELARQLKPDFERRTSLSSLLFRGALIELALLALRKLPVQTEVLRESEAERTVESARQWFSERAHLNPSIGTVAREMHVSVSTLRRRFQQARQGSPAHVFEEVRIELAMQLMSATDSKLDVVAGRCGYSCTSDFCRAFKAFTGLTPNVWRRTAPGSPIAAPRFGTRDFEPAATAAELPMVAASDRWSKPVGSDFGAAGGYFRAGTLTGS